MNVLIDGMPTAVEINEVEYPINSDFRTCLRIMEAFEDTELTGYEKQSIMLSLLFPDVPNDVQAAMLIAVKFLNCGKESEESGGESDNTRYYSWTQDARYIMSAIEQTYHIDLSTADLHWWRFVGMFLDLDENCFFSRLIYLRKQKAKGKLTKDEEEWYYSIRDIVDLPETYTTDEQSAIDNFMAQLGQ